MKLQWYLKLNFGRPGILADNIQNKKKTQIIIRHELFLISF